MAKEKISELTAAGALTGDELVPVVQDGETLRTTAQDIADLGGGGALGYDVYAATLTQVEASVITSGPLVVGRIYNIGTYGAGDDFANVANVLEGTINTQNCIFIATGTTPTNYSNGSALDVYQYLESPVILGTNTIGTIVWEFDPVNNWYTGTLEEAFTTDGKTVCFGSFANTAGQMLNTFDVVDTDSVKLDVSSGAGSFAIEIRVYP